MLTQVRDTYRPAFIMAKGVRLDHSEPAGDGFTNFFFPARECGPFLTEWYGPDATANVHECQEAPKRLRQMRRDEAGLRRIGSCGGIGRHPPQPFTGGG